MLEGTVIHITFNASHVWVLLLRWALATLRSWGLDPRCCRGTWQYQQCLRLLVLYCGDIVVPIDRDYAGKAYVMTWNAFLHLILEL